MEFARATWQVRVSWAIPWEKGARSVARSVPRRWLERVVGPAIPGETRNRAEQGGRMEKGQKRRRKGGKDLAIASARGQLASACLPVRVAHSKSGLQPRVACFSSFLPFVENQFRRASERANERASHACCFCSDFPTSRVVVSLKSLENRERE